MARRYYTSSSLRRSLRTSTCSGVWLTPIPVAQPFPIRSGFAKKRSPFENRRNESGPRADHIGRTSALRRRVREHVRKREKMSSNITASETMRFGECRRHLERVSAIAPNFIMPWRQDGIFDVSRHGCHGLAAYPAGSPHEDSRKPNVCQLSPLRAARLVQPFLPLNS